MIKKVFRVVKKVLLAIGNLLVFVGIPVAVGMYFHSVWLGLAAFLVLSLVLLAVEIKKAMPDPYDEYDLD
jgi:membrane protein implicated in regulation of membrane protease activity